MKTGTITVAATLTIIGFSTQLTSAQPYDAGDRGGYQGSHGQDYEHGPSSREERMRMMMDRWRAGGMGGHEMAEEGMSGRSGGAARFRFRRGDASMDIRCPQNETLRDCVQAVSQLLDKMNSFRPSSSSQGAGTTSPPVSTPTVPGAPQ